MKRTLGKSLLILTLIVSIVLLSFAATKVQAPPPPTPFYVLQVVSVSSGGLFTGVHFNVTFTDLNDVLYVNETKQTPSTMGCKPGTYANVTWVQNATDGDPGELHVFDHFVPANNVTGDDGDTLSIALFHVAWYDIGFAVAPVDSGTINHEPSPIGNNWYAHETWYNVSAEALLGYVFLGYGTNLGNIAFLSPSDPENQFKAKGPDLITAHFKPWPYANFTESAHTVLQGTQIDFNASNSVASGRPGPTHGYIQLYEWDWETDGTYDYSSATPTANHIFMSPGTYEVTLRITDDQNLHATVKDTKTILPDTVPPVTKLTIGEPKCVNTKTFVMSETPFTLDATDEGLGVLSTAYRIRNTTYSSGWQTYTAPFKLTSLADGTYTIEYNSTDKAMNVEPTHSVDVTLFSWTCLFKDSAGRGTILKINTAYKLFQFITPDKDFGIMKDNYMGIWLGMITIQYRGNVLYLSAFAMNTKTHYCNAHAINLQIHKGYILIDWV